MTKRLNILGLAAAAILLAAAFIGTQADAAQEPGSFATVRVGEKITYAISFGKFSNVAFAEISAVSRGKLSDRDAVELRGRFKTLDLFSAAFYLIDETRTVFADAESGLPLYINSVQNAGSQPRETNFNYLAVPAQGYDLLTLIYKIRQAGGNGALTLVEDGKTYVVTMQVVAAERVKTDAGEYDTSVVAVQSDYFTERGMKEVRVNLSNDEAKIPARVRIKTGKGEFKIDAASVQVNEPEVVPTPVLVQTPVVVTPQVPRPVATPTPYVENQPLGAELAFDLGETLEYRITSAGQPVGNFTFQVRERKLFDGRDGVMLKAWASRSEAGNRFFALNDGATAVVNPDTLVPSQSEIRFGGTLNSYNQMARFDSASGSIALGGASAIEAPIGTHSILSLFYALRSFNLKPSKDTKNPVNDTRVAVLWETQPYIFSLRPAEPAPITVNGLKVPAQMISITTQNAYLDQLGPRIWLSTDERRLPLKFAFGSIEGELVNVSPASR